MRKMFTYCFTFFFGCSVLCSQSKTIRGRVIAEDFETLPGVSIMIDDTVELGVTDFDGFFEVEIPLSKKNLSFDFIGMESVTIDLVGSCTNLEVTMMYLYSYDFVSLKRAESKRKRRYKKIPQIHKKAFERGIFESDCSCYKRDFQSFYLPASARLQRVQ